MAIAVAEFITVAILDPRGLSPKPGKESRAPLRCVFCGLSHLHPAINCTAYLGACPHANSSGCGAIAGTDLGTGDASDFGTGTDLNANYGTGTDDPGADAGDRPATFIGPDVGFGIGSINGSTGVSDACVNTRFSVDSPSAGEHSIGTNAALRVAGLPGSRWQGASASCKCFFLIVARQGIGGHSHSSGT